MLAFGTGPQQVTYDDVDIRGGYDPFHQPGAFGSRFLTKRVRLKLSRIPDGLGTILAAKSPLSRSKKRGCTKRQK